MLPIFIIGAALGTAMVSSNKSFATKINRKQPIEPINPSLPKEPSTPVTPVVPIDSQSPINPVVTEPIIVNPIVTNPILITPITGVAPTTSESIITDITNASVSNTTTQKKGSLIIGELDKGSYGPAKKTGKIIIPPLDKGEFVADPPKLKGSIIIPPLDKGSFDKPKRRGTVTALPIENYGKFMPDQVVQGNIIVLPQVTVTNPPKKSVKIIIEPIESLTKKGTDWENQGTNTGGASGGGGGGDFGGGFSGGISSAGGGSIGWDMNSWLMGLNLGGSGRHAGPIEVIDLGGEFLTEQT